MPGTIGSQIITTLHERGITHVFGYSGGAALPLFDALYNNTHIQLITSRHEQGAAHMADGFARASGIPAGVLVTSGPGATNILTGLMTAHRDNIPMIALTGQVPTHAIGSNAFQEADIVAMSKTITKAQALTLENTTTISTLHSLIDTAISGRPGPVLLDIPKDISASHALPSPPSTSPTPQRRAPNPTIIREIAQLWRAAKRPLILAGHGVIIAGASSLLTTLARQEATPVTTTLLGKGAFPETDELSLGMLGMHGTAYANHAVMAADFVLIIGSRCDDRIVGKPSEFLARATVIHIDIDPNELGRVITPHIALRSDAHTALTALANALTHAPIATERATWTETIAADKRAFPLSYDPTQLSMQAVIDAVHAKTAGDAIVTTDVGQHQMWAAQFWKNIEPRSWISSGGAGTMGFALPAAIGAQFAQPNKTVIAFAGDGGFQMTLHELATAVAHTLPLKIFILDNAYLGMVRQWQETFYDGRYAAVDMSDNPDFGAIARAYGAQSITIDSLDELSTGIDTALAITDTPVVIHVRVPRTDNVYPFIPAGASYATMQLGPSGEKLDAPTGST